MVLSLDKEPLVSLSSSLKMHQGEGAEYEIILACPEEYLMRVRQFAIEVHQGPKPEYRAEYLKEYFHTRGFRTYEAKGAFGMSIILIHTAGIGGLPLP